MAIDNVALREYAITRTVSRIEHSRLRVLWACAAVLFAAIFGLVIGVTTLPTLTGKTIAFFTCMLLICATAGAALVLLKR